MIVPDLNLLLYAYNPYSPKHEKAIQWWQDTVNGSRLIGFPHEILFGFIRISTNPALEAAAVPMQEATKVVNSWRELPNSRILLPGPDHFSRVMQLMEHSNSTNRVLSDAVLASHAIENRATLYSNDSDFARFPNLDWKNPLIK